MSQDKKHFADSFHDKLSSHINAFGNVFISLFHYSALFAIGAIIAWSAFLQFKLMFTQNAFGIEHILTLFIFLELGAMVGIYFKTQQMPVRYLIYIAITALTRLLILEASEHDKGLDAGIKLLLEAGAIFFLCISIFIIRYAAQKYPTPKDDVQEQA